MCYVGRAEHDLRDVLKAHAAEYLYYWYEPAITQRDAFQTECYEFHKHADSGEMKDAKHPIAPEKIDQKCPVCGK